jgi:pimeloyl-ACP methyl ester carboxylesterase
VTPARHKYQASPGPAGTHGGDCRRQREPSAGGVAELIREEIGGHDLAVLIRGAVATKPVLLFLAGGPGGTETGAMRRHGQGLEQDFVVATFDQRGSGGAYDNLEPTSTLTLAQAISDTVEVTNYLRDLFHQKGSMSSATSGRVR